ncbi:MAG: hypothetical protein RL398_3637 [Planctomycetota bacterium]|jgi:hypothetical protein
MRACLAALVACAACLGGLAAQQPAAVPTPATPVQNPFKPFDRAAFEKTVRELGGTDAQVLKFGSEIEEFGLSRAGDRLVRAVVPAYDAAAKLFEESDPSAALALAKVLNSAETPLLRAHVRYTLARVFRDSDDPARAVEVLGQYLQHDLNRSPLDAEATYFYAQSLADVPEPELAIPRFRAFLQWFPEASERYRSAALQQIADLERQRESRLHQLADGMARTRRDLKQGKTDKPVQVDQEKYLDELQELIEMFEEMESQQSGAPNGNGQSQAPAKSSALPGGEASVGNLNKRASLADRWGDMKDSEREKIESEVQNNLPPQYRKMLEEYYKKLGKSQRP